METNQFFSIKFSLVLIFATMLVGIFTIAGHLQIIENNSEETVLILNVIKDTQYIQLCQSLYKNTEDFRTCIKSPMIPF